MLDSQVQDEAVRQFADVLANAGLLLKGLPIMDGRLHHVPTRGAKTKGDNAGVYIGHLDGGVPAGWWNNYRTDPFGEGHKWKATGVKDTRSWAEIQKARDEADRVRAQEEQKRAEKEERIARWAERKWNRSEPAVAHPYLERKGIEAHGLRVDEKNHLVVPMQDLNGKTWSLQTISAEGEKHYTAGGRKKGLHTIVGTYDPAKPLAFAEGFATAASVHQATGLAVVVVFDSGSLKPVAEAYRARNGAQSFVFAADNDHHLPLKQAASGRVLQNVGVEKAEEAARAVGGSVAIPNFEDDNPGTDWNDYAAQHGLGALREAFGGLSQISANTPWAAKTERTGLKQHPPAIERPLPNQEVSMLEQQSTIAPGAIQSEATETEVAGVQQPQKIPHKRVTAVPEQPTHRTIKNTEGFGETPPLERLSRRDVERALQTGASLVQKDLSGLDLSNLKFDGINLAGSNLSGTRNINTTYESSRLDGANFSDAVFRNSTIECVFAVNSHWDRAQFDRTNIVFSNFGSASFRDALFRDDPRSRDREEPTRKQAQNGEAPETEDRVRAVHKPGNSAWAEVAAHAGTFLRDLGKALKDASVEVYQKVREWWTQPLELASEIERNTAASWITQPPGYAAYDEPQAQAWTAPHAERVQAQGHADANAQIRSNDKGMSRTPEQNKNQDGANRVHTTGTRSSDRPSQASPDVITVDRERLQPALIARNNFQFADLSGARFESIRVQDNDFRHAVLTNAQFPAELHGTNKIERDVAGTRQSLKPEVLVKETVEPFRQAKTARERHEDRAELAETIRRDIESREHNLREGDPGLYRNADALRLAKEMLRQIGAGADRIDLTTTYKAGDQATADERHVRAYNSVNPLIAEAYARGITVDRGSATLDRVQAITKEAARLHEDVNATNHAQDRKELVAETKDLAAESVSLRTDGEAKEDEIRSNLDREGIAPLMSMEQERFDALLSVGVFDSGKSPEWRKEMDQKISERFAALSADAGRNESDQRALWQEAAKQVQQGKTLTQQACEATPDREREIDDQNEVLAQKQEFRRAVALAR